MCVIIYEAQKSNEIDVCLCALEEKGGSHYQEVLLENEACDEGLTELCFFTFCGFFCWIHFSF